MDKHMRYDHFVQRKSFGEESIWVYRTEGSRKSDLPLFVLHGGKSSWKRNGIYQRSESRIFAVEQVTAGDCFLVHNGQETIVSEGEFFLLHRGEQHEYRTGPSGFLQKCYVAFDGLSLESLISALDLYDVSHLVLPNPEDAIQKMGRLIALLGEEGSSLLEEVSVAAYRLLLALKPPGEIGMPPMVRDVLNYMYKNLDRGLTVDDLVAVSRVSPPHLNRVFRRYVGQSPISYFHSQKMQWTANLLATTTLSIKEIAYRGGFDNPLYFSSRFRHHFQKSPSEYRKQHQSFYHPDNEVSA